MAAFCSRRCSTARAASGWRMAGGSTWEWLMERAGASGARCHSPRSLSYMALPSTLPQTVRSRSRGAAYSCSTVWMPQACSRRSSRLPMPWMSRSANASMRCGSSSRVMTVRPSGLCILEACLASRIFGPMPMETRRHSPRSSCRRCLSCPASQRARSGVRQLPVSSHAISSIDITRSTGTRLSTTATARWCICTYSSGRASRTMSLGQSRRASLIRVPVRMPCSRAS